MFGGTSLSRCMQHVLTVLTYPGSCKTCFFHISVFGGKVSFIFPTIDLIVDLKLICIIDLSDLINPLILPTSTLDDIFTHFGGFFSIFMSQLALKFHWDKKSFFLACIDSVNITNYIKITWSVMPKPGYLLTVQEAHKEYNSLTDQIWAKYKQLDSGEYRAIGTPAFNAEACELANLLACLSQVCQKLNLLSPKELYRPMFFKYWRHFSDLNTLGRQFF